LSVFFKKVQATNLGEILRKKYIEKQVEKAEGVYRYLCSGTSGLNPTFLDDLLRPLNGGDRNYQIKILTYFSFVMDKIRHPEEVDAVFDTYPDYWNQDELSKDAKLKSLCKRIVTAADELWELTDDAEVRGLIIRIRYGEYTNKRELFEQIKGKLERETLSETAREKIAHMLHCFLLPDADDTLKLQVSHELLFKVRGVENQEAALGYLRFYVENKNLNYAEKGSIATVMEMFLEDSALNDALRQTARYILFIAAPERISREDEQKAILGYLRNVIEGQGFTYREAEVRVVQSLIAFAEKVATSEKLKKAAHYLEFKIRNPTSAPA
jgi:hypothetical protein